MTIKKTIEKAIEGGWKNWERHFTHKTNIALDGEDEFGIVAQIILDPSFWQALGKSLGWEKKCSVGSLCDENNRHGCPHDEAISRWHTLIDHLDIGGSIESYFKTL